MCVCVCVCLYLLQALYRINRDISLSRAIGDRDLKPFGVIATPDVSVHTFNPDTGPAGRQTLLVVASDGVWDVLSPETCAKMLQETVDDVQPSVANSSSGPAVIAKVAAKRLTDAAHSVVKNNDDVTAIVVSLCQPATARQ